MAGGIVARVGGIAFPPGGVDPLKRQQVRSSRSQATAGAPAEAGPTAPGLLPRRCLLGWSRGLASYGDPAPARAVSGVTVSVGGTGVSVTTPGGSVGVAVGGSNVAVAGAGGVLVGGGGIGVAVGVPVALGVGLGGVCVRARSISFAACARVTVLYARK
jgi:hypothetical protein